mgnify:CR=1 FL=1
MRQRLKLGAHEEATNRTRVSELMRYQTFKSGDELISFKEYVDRMKEGRNGLLHHGRQTRGRFLFPVPRGDSKEGLGGVVHGGGRFVE